MVCIYSKLINSYQFIVHFCYCISDGQKFPKNHIFQVLISKCCYNHEHWKFMMCTCLFHFDSYFLFSSASRDYIKKEKPSLKMFEGVVVLSFLFILRLPFWLLLKTPVGLKIMTKNIGHHSRQYNRAIIELKSMNYYCMLISTFLKVDWISEVQTWDICVGCALRVNIIMWIRVGTM